MLFHRLFFPRPKYSNVKMNISVCFRGRIGEYDIGESCDTSLGKLVHVVSGTENCLSSTSSRYEAVHETQERVLGFVSEIREGLKSFNKLYFVI
jgi:hypothetical protein